MVAWRLNLGGVSRPEVGAGIVAAAAALVASVMYIPGLWVLDALFPAVPHTTELYFFLYTGFIFYALLVAPFVAMVLGTAVWRWMTVPTSSPRRGALAGIVTALGTMLVVPILFSLLLIAWEFIRAAWWSPESYSLFGSTLQSFVVVTQGGIVYWSPLAGVILLPLGALVGWAYQRGRHLRGR